MAESDKLTSERQKRAIAREYAHAVIDALNLQGSWDYVSAIERANFDVPDWQKYIPMYRGE